MALARIPGMRTVSWPGRFAGESTRVGLRDPV